MSYKFSLRRKFLLFNLFFLAVIGLLIYVLNVPYRAMDSLMNDLRHDIAQIMEAEKFVKTVYEQQHEVAKLVLGREEQSGKKEFDRLNADAAAILARWRSAFASAEFTAEKRAELQRHLEGAAAAAARILKLSERAVELAQNGDNAEAVRIMDQIDLIIMENILPDVDGITRELKQEVSEDLPLLFGSLEQTAVIPLFKTDIHLKEMASELEHALKIQEISRFFSGQYLDILHAFAGSSYGTERMKYADFRKKIRKMLDEWLKGAGVENGAEDRTEDEREIEMINSMLPLLDRLEKAGAEAMALAEKDNRALKYGKFRSELGEIENRLASRFDSLIANEEHEIKKRIDAIIRVVDRVRSSIFIGNVLIALAGMLIIWFQFSNMIAPVIRLRDASVRIGQGDFTVEVSSHSRDEIGELAEAFEGMRKNMLSAMNDLKDEIIVRRRAEAEKEDVIREIKQALAHIKTLSGLLPICASCKKIRDDRGYWNQLESYISEHSEAEFTHGYCPDCAAKFREELDKLKSGRKQG